MRLSNDPRTRALLVAAAVVLLILLCSWKLPLIRLLIALTVAYLAWVTSDNQNAGKRRSSFSNDRSRFSGLVSEDREESGCRVCRYVFSNAALDLTDSSALPVRMEIQSAFSNLSVRLPVDADITIHASGAFCSISMPGQQHTVFGERISHCGTQDPLAPKLHIYVSCAFGAVSFQMG